MLPASIVPGILCHLDELECRWKSKYPKGDVAWPPGLKGVSHSTGFGPKSIHCRESALEEELSWLWRKHSFATGESRPDHARISNIPHFAWGGTLDDREELPCPKRRKRGP